MSLPAVPYLHSAQQKASTKGFTIVELLIVVVVIAILAAITIVAYNGIRERAVASALQSDLSSAAKALKLDHVRLNGYPSALTGAAGANNGKGLSFDSGAAATYTVDEQAPPQAFCLQLTRSGVSYFITQSEGPTVGTCTPTAPPVPTYADIVLADNPAAYWRFQNTTGTTVDDASGNGRVLTQSNATGIGATGLSSDSGDFSWDMPGSGATYGSVLNESWQHVPTFTAEAIIQPDSTTSYKGIISHDGISTRSWSFYIYNGNLMVYDYSASGSNLAVSSTTLQVGRRYHVAMTFSSNTIRLYINGAQTSTQTASLRTSSSGRPMIVGGSHAGATTPTYLFDGRIDEVAFYQTALSAARLTAHARAAGL